MSDAEADYEIYPKTTWIAFSWLSRFSGAFSVIGSSLIIFIIIRGGKEKLSRIHNRLLLCMSSVDVMNSMNLGVGLTLNPSEAHPEYIYGAKGNNTTCNIQGFVLTASFTVPIYNSILCLYYMAVIRYNVNEEVLKRIEPYAHGIAILLPLGCAIYALSADLYRPSGVGYCAWSNGCITRERGGDTPEFCDHERSKKLYLTILDWFFYVMGGAVFLVIVCSMTLTYLAVRHQASKMKKYLNLRRGSFTPTNETSPTQSLRAAVRRSSFTLRTTSHNESLRTPRRNSCTEFTFADAQRQKGGKDEETFTQAILYVLSYVSSYSFPIACTMIGTASEPLPTALILCTAFFYPLQGFWNFCTYVRPKYIIVKQTMEDLSFFGVLKIVIMIKNIDQFLQQERAKMRTDINRVNSSRLRVLENAKMYGEDLSPSSILTPQKLWSPDKDCNKDEKSQDLSQDENEIVKEQESPTESCVDKSPSSKVLFKLECPENDEELDEAV